MQLLQKSFFYFKTNIWQSLALSIFLMTIFFVANLLSIFGFILASFVLVLVQFEVLKMLTSSHNLRFNYRLQKPSLDFLSNIVFSLLLTPTIIMLGSAFGMIQGLSYNALSISVLFIFTLIVSFSLIVLTQSLCFCLKRDTTAFSAMKLANDKIKKEIKSYFLISFLVSILIDLSIFSYGIGFVVTIPLILYTLSLSTLAPTTNELTSSPLD